MYNEPIVIAKDSSKHNVTNVQIHDIVFKIMVEIDRICRKNKIDYALAFGSALGLDNFNDFVPWDDDADIVIDYFDYDRLINALKKDLSQDFEFDSFANNKKYNVLIPAIKVKFKNSHIVEKNHFFIPNRGCKCDGLFVDICLLMGVPSNNKKHKRLFWKSKLLMPLICGLDSLLHINPLCLKKSLLKYEKKIALKYQNSDTISQTVIIPFQELPRRIVKNLSFPRNVIYPFKEYEFHGRKFYSFNNVHEFSLLRYGEFKNDTKHKTNHLKTIDIL